MEKPEKKSLGNTELPSKLFMPGKENLVICDEARRPKGLGEENTRLKRLVADQALNIQIFKDVNSKKW